VDNVGGKNGDIDVKTCSKKEWRLKIKGLVFFGVKRTTACHKKAHNVHVH